MCDRGGLEEILNTVSFFQLSFHWDTAADECVCTIIDRKENVYKGFSSKPFGALEAAIKRWRESDIHSGVVTLSINQSFPEQTSLDSLSPQTLAEEELRGYGILPSNVLGK
jgi:hypothetical protein